MGKATRNALVVRYLRFVHHAIRKMIWRIPRSLDYDDLVQAGTIGLMRAAELYDPSRGAFMTFAMWHVRSEVWIAIKRSNLIAIPDRFSGAERRRIFRRVHLGGLPVVLSAKEPGPYEAAVISERNELINRALDKLNTRDATVIRHRYWDDWTLQRIGDHYGISKQRVDQIERRALSHLRDLLGNLENYF